MPAATSLAAGLFVAQRVLALDASQDSYSCGIRRVDITTGATTTLAGNSIAGFKDDDVGTSAQFRGAQGVAIDPSGAFALVAVRAPAPLHPARRVAFPRRGAPSSHTCPRPVYSRPKV